MIDLHCHILPGADDGAGSEEESLAMARLAVEDGVRAIVATPHALNGVYTNPAGKIISQVAALREALSKSNIELELYAGADVHLCPHILKRIQKGEACTINNAMKYILLELPSRTILRGVKEEVFSLKVNGITPIITHPERNALIQQDAEALYELVSMGALAQVTAMSVTGGFGTFVARSAENLLRNRLVHMIVSDAHSPDYRPPVLSRAVERAAEILGDHEEAERMVQSVPNAILENKVPEVPEPSPGKPKKWFFARFFK
ncbi:MAG: hypothetical protein GY849_04990 [Deltaproteobacteria bacterium]|nr:hypothetical protein [Deltaproteobacteria bacterium]